MLAFALAHGDEVGQRLLESGLHLRPGLVAGDLLIGANGKRFASVDDLHESLANANRSLAIQFLRGGERKERETTVRTKCLTNEFEYS